VDIWGRLSEGESERVCRIDCHMTASFSYVSSYDGGVIVDRSIDLNQPVVYVSLNYRYARVAVVGKLV
jgi:hypothetical protein